MALVEFHQILLSSLGGGESPKLLPLPILPGPSLALVSLRRHFPQATALHYWLDPFSLVTLPKVCKGEESHRSGGVTFSSEGTFFILPFLDPSVNFFVTEEEYEKTGLNARVALLEGLVEEQRDVFTSIHSLLSQAGGTLPQIFNVNADRVVNHLECRSSLDNQDVCADCTGEPKSNLNPESEAFFPWSYAIPNGCDQLHKVSPLNPNCKTFQPIIASNSLDNELQADSLFEEASENEHMAGRLFKVPSSLNPHCEPFDPSALLSEHSIGDISKGSANKKENKEDENNNTKACVELESAADTSSTLGKCDKAKETAVSNAKAVVVEDEMCKSIRPKIILKANCRRKS